MLWDDEETHKSATRGVALPFLVFQNTDPQMPQWLLLQGPIIPWLPQHVFGWIFDLDFLPVPVELAGVLGHDSKVSSH
jgi:hypothetical protein